MMFCPNCESQDVTVTRVSVSARRFGLPGGQLSGVERIACNECDEASFNVPAHGAVVKEYRRQLVHLARDLNAEEFAFLRRSLGMTGKAYADALQVSNVTISRIENGNPIPAMQQGMIRAVTLLDLVSLDAIAQFVSREGAEVNVDIAAVERSQVHDVSNGWQELPATLPSNVVIFPGAARQSRAIGVVEFTACTDGTFDELLVCNR